MPTTFTALAVALLAILPGAACMFAYGARVGSYGLTLPDRIFRFLAVSIVFQAILSGPSYAVYRAVLRTGKLERGEVSLWVIEVMAVGYVVIPYVIGFLIGEGVSKNVSWLRSLSRGSPEPRAWDFLFSNRQPNGIVRIKLKSGPYIAGVFGISEDGKKSHASGYPEAGDLYLSQSVTINKTTGEFLNLNPDGKPEITPGGILLRWEEIEFLEIFE